MASSAKPSQSQGLKLISAYSKSPHFNALAPTAHIPGTSAVMRDEIGLTPSASYYVVPSPFQERSSSKRKDLFRRIQGRHEDTPAEVAKQMVLDMKVRWSTTYAMLDTRFNLKEEVDTFVFKVAMDEVGKKRQKLMALQLTEAE
ncbi:hypothetical protein C8J57DRAFT_1262379 [Mycena rebaudengoi]|nr:hypothetical protein C8J57DRAFT_1262379 [Mycena rebaudengoi]